MKKFLALITALFILVFTIPVSATAETAAPDESVPCIENGKTTRQADDGGVSRLDWLLSRTESEKNALANNRETNADAVIYALEDWAIAKDVSIPSDYLTSYQIPVQGSGVSYRITAGNSVTVSSSGLVEPRIRCWYWYGSIGYSTPISGREPDSVTYEICTGVSTVTAYSGGTTTDYTIEVADYADTYARERMMEYINSNISDSMSLYDKLDKICAYVADFDYDARYQSATRMVICGGGDCWASTNTILAMCELLGIQAFSRNGNKDSGAGSGHRNVLVLAGDGTYYVCEAGYVGSAPRTYSIYTRTSLFCYRNITGGIEVYQYDCIDPEQTVLNIPQTIDGKTVVSIGYNFLYPTRSYAEITIPSTVTKISDYAFAYCSELTEFFIPEGVTYIGEGAFYSCYKLKNINIPASAVTIGNGAFLGCNEMQSLTCASENPNYTVEDNILYDKDKKTICQVVARSEVNVPDTVTSINEYAFSHNSKLISVTIPDSVTEIPCGAFYDCVWLKNVNITGNNLLTIDESAFADCHKLESINIPDSVTSIGKQAFYLCVAMDSIVINNPDCSIYDDASTVPKNAVIYGYSGSTAEAYADKYDRSFVAISEGGIEGIKVFVTRLYSICLDREPEADGLAYWTDLLLSNVTNGADVAYGFFFSDEYQAPNKSDEDYVLDLYETFMGRVPAQEEVDYWVGVLAGGATREDVYTGFTYSDEWKYICYDYGITPNGSAPSAANREENVYAFARRLYTCCLGREADEEGLGYWADLLLSRQATGTGAAYGFFFSDEFVNADYSDREFILRLYSTLMDRVPSEEDIGYWCGELSSGAARNDIFTGFASSQEFKNICDSYSIRVS